MSISLKHLVRSYGALHAVNDISLTIPPNTVYGIIGKSGAGKSTLVRLISLLERPDQGEVYFNDKRVDNLPKEQLIAQRRKIGMIFQNFNLFSSRSAAQNIAYPLEICGHDSHYIDQRVKELLTLVGLEGRGKAPISTLSGGQKQRVAIARSLANNPDILFCDEATSSLDPQTTRSILTLIGDLQKKMALTVVMITHQMEVVRDACEYVAVLEDGMVVEKGKVADVFSRPVSATTKDFLAHLAPVIEKKSDIIRWSAEGGALHATLQRRKNRRAGSQSCSKTI
ncbi:MAG: methionine ABC transporter ATP-binding protein [Sphaerochaetaceae bacterium]